MRKPLTSALCSSYRRLNLPSLFPSLTLTSGTCVATPTSGNALTTIFLLTSPGWTTDASNFPLSYAYAFQVSPGSSLLSISALRYIPHTSPPPPPPPPHTHIDFQRRISFSFSSQQHHFLLVHSTTSFSSSPHNNIFVVFQPKRFFQHHPSRRFGYFQIPNHGSVPSRRYLFLRGRCKCRCDCATIFEDERDESLICRLDYGLHEWKHQFGFPGDQQYSYQCESDRLLERT